MSSTVPALSDLFVRSLLTDPVLLQPHELGSNYTEILHKRLNDTLAGRCSRHGFIEPDSIKIRKIREAEVVASALNGNVQFSVQYYANVCNPAVGAVIPARAVNRNKFGIQAHSGVMHENGDFLPVIQSIVTTTAITKASDVDVGAIGVGDEFFIEILIKQFHLGEPRIRVIGRIVKDFAASTGKSVRSPLAISAFAAPVASAAAAAAEDVGDNDDIEVESDEDDEDEEEEEREEDEEDAEEEEEEGGKTGSDDEDIDNEDDDLSDGNEDLEGDDGYDENE